MEVADDFHARYAARSKTYRYRILQTPVCSPFLERFVWHYPYKLDRRGMAAAAMVDGTEEALHPVETCRAIRFLASDALRAC